MIRCFGPAALCLLAGAVIVACASSAASAAEWYVAPNGKDTDPGTRAKPFATLARARDAARSAPAADTKKRIVLRGGRYYDVSVELRPEDSGLTIEAARGEKPVLYGGVPLRGWERDGERFISAPAPPGAQVRMLEVGGVMAPRARFPAEGTLTHENVFSVRWMSSTGGGWERKPTSEELTTLRYKAGDLSERMDIKSAEVTVYHMWDESSVGVSAIDSATRTLTLSPATGHPPGAFGVQKYVLWNTREGLTKPGQWQHDRTRNRIVYWPLPGQDMTKTAVIAGTRENILRLRGTRDRPIENMNVRGLSFSVTTVPLISAGFAAADFDGAVSMDYATGCAVEGVTVARVAGHAIQTRVGCVGTRVIDCDVADCGAGGVYVGGTDSLIENCHIRNIGLAYPSAIGIYRGSGRNNVVRHNEVHGCSYSAINYGGENNVIENNLIYDCMKVLHDGAAIYLFGAKNSVIRGNLARDITDTGGYGASAYYLDEQSEGCVVENNVSIRVGWPTHNHMAKKNTIRNNVFVIPAGDAKLTFPRSSDYTLEGNVIYAEGKIRIESVNAVTQWSNNLFFSKAGRIETVEQRDYQSVKTEQGVLPGDTVAADPLFVAPEKGDFRYREGSPARKLGLKPVDVSRAGRLKGRSRK